MKPIDRQLKILDQATFLIGMAKAENTDLSISQAIEIIKIDSLKQLEDIFTSGRKEHQKYNFFSRE